MESSGKILSGLFFVRQPAKYHLFFIQTGTKNDIL